MDASFLYDYWKPLRGAQGCEQLALTYDCFAPKEEGGGDM